MKVSQSFAVIYIQIPLVLHMSGADPGFCLEGSQHKGGSLKQGPPEAIGGSFLYHLNAKFSYLFKEICGMGF